MTDNKPSDFRSSETNDVEKYNLSTRITPCGQGIVEFALVRPLLLVLMLGVIEFGRLLFFYSSTFTASREAARYGSAAGNVGG
jgi:hypothetical protein